MSALEGSLTLVVLALVWTLNKGEHCVVNQSCILPCRFQPGDDVVIHWIQQDPERTAHSFFDNVDQLSHQDKHFVDRTSLFTDQISHGNASLTLTRVEVQDQGRYKCYTSSITGNKEAFLDLQVEAPVHKVHIQREDERISCSSEEVYPEPRLTWSTSSSPAVAPADKPTVQRTEQQLYNISSSLVLSDTSESERYTCTISAGRHTHTATWFKPTQTSGSEPETMISCPDLNTSWRRLIWTFNHSQIIMDHSVSDSVFKEWRQHVKEVSATGSLTLQHLTSDQAGVYTCEISSDEETSRRDTYLLVTEKHGNAGSVAGVVIGIIILVILVIVVIVVSGFCLYKKRKGTSSRTNSNGITDTQTSPPLEGHRLLLLQPDSK